MARPTFADATALARQIIDDRDQGGGYIFTDALLVPFGSSAQRRIFKAMKIAGLMTANNEAAFTIPAGTNHIDWTDPGSGLVLPNDFEQPLKLWEKASTDPDSAYIEMSNNSELLPTVDQIDTLRYWVWEDSGPNGTMAIKFLGATSDRIVKILYLREGPKIVDGTSTLYVPGSTDAMASCMVWLADKSRGSDWAADSKAEYLSDLDDLMRVFKKGEQRRPRRRPPYGFMKTFRG